MSDLVSACVFCAGLLLGMDAPVRSGMSADVGVSYVSSGGTDALLSLTWDRSRLPFVALAPLGTETVAFEQGYHPDATTRELFGEGPCGMPSVPPCACAPSFGSATATRRSV